MSCFPPGRVSAEVGGVPVPGGGSVGVRWSASLSPSESPTSQIVQRLKKITCRPVLCLHHNLKKKSKFCSAGLSSACDRAIGSHSRDEAPFSAAQTS